jgi:N-acyl-D-aspartate/D-glutamate deacylase
MYELALRGGTVFDGTGAPGVRADIGLREGRIVAVGGLDDSAEVTLDVGGLVVSPGFVDVHTHYDIQGFWDPALTPSPLHGVTTVFGGNCGFSVAPISEATAEYVLEMLARVEGMPLESLRVGVPWTWRTTAEFLNALDGRLALNAGFLVGHSVIRRAVMGSAATERTARPEEVAAMQELLRAGLSVGGMGFSSSWGITHFDGNGDPVPSRHADSAELIALAGVCRSFEGTSLEFLPLGGPEPFTTEVAELMVEMSVAAGRPVNWNVMSVTAASLEAWQGKLAVSDEAAARGGRVVALAIPETPPVRYTMRGGTALDALPGWSEVMALPPDEKIHQLSDPVVRRRLDEMGRSPSRMRHFAEWATKVITEAFTPETKAYEGKSVGDIARAQGKEPLDALLDIVVADGLRTVFINEPRYDSDADWRARCGVLRDPRVVIGGSDAGAHVDMLATSNYPTRLLQEAVRDRGLMEMEEAVHLMTDVPAQLYGLRDRGRVEVGYAADLVVFDPQSVASEPVRLVDDLPGGGARLFAGSIGVNHVFVNGVEILADGALTGRTPGTLLRSGRDTRTPALTR